MRTIEVTVTYIDELLGTASADPDIHRRFIASKAPDAARLEDEVAARWRGLVGQCMGAAQGGVVVGRAQSCDALRRPCTALQRDGVATMGGATAWHSSAKLRQRNAERRLTCALPGNG